ncbi:MAG TPA: hypothetical protein VD741_05020 [Solirubrobacterales bacterium]|nr:hypothetical protein [Solirubrobacterales bacterium]
MDVDRLSLGEKIAGASAVLLFIFMFFDWFTVDVEGGFISVDVGNAWETLDLIPIILMLAIIAALAVVVIRLTDAIFEPPVSINAIVAILGAISVLLILYRIVNPPDAGVEGIDVGPALGIFLSLLAAAGLTYGGYRAMQEEGTSFGDLGDQFSNRGGPGAGPPQQPPSSTPPPPPPAS